MIGNLLEKTKFENLNLNSPLLKVLNEEGYDYPTPIQFQTIPSALQGSDILGIAQTGTGKTAAFTLPILQKLNSTQSRDKFRHPKAIILSPTRELTIQINNSIKIYAKYIALKHVAVFGGVKQGPQVALLNKGVDIIVATPGRLLDLINQKLCSLEEIVYFVLDEADRMLDMGFIRDVEKIVNLLPKKRQSLFFSATMPKTVTKLADNILKNPKKVKIKSSVTPIDRISQSVIVIEPQEKISQLVTLLNDNSLKSVIVFIKTKHKANRVCQKLTQIGIVTDVIHSNKSQSARQKALNDFKEGKITLPIILAYGRSNNEEKKFLQNVISNPKEDQKNFKLTKELLVKYKCIEDTLIRANHFADVAIDSLSIFNDNEYKEALIKLIDTSIKRLA